LATKNNLRKCREEKGLSIKELSQLANVSATTIQRLEGQTLAVTNRMKHRVLNGLNKSNHNDKQYKFGEVFPLDDI